MRWMFAVGLVCTLSAAHANTFNFVDGGSSTGSSGAPWSTDSTTGSPSWTDTSPGTSSPNTTTAALTPSWATPSSSSLYSGGATIQGGGPQPTITFQPQAGDYRNLQENPPHRWDAFPIKVHVNYPDQFPTNARNQVNNAIADWKRHMPIEVAQNADSAHIRITWAKDLDGAYGKTKYSQTEGANGYVRLKLVEISMLHPEKYGSLPETALKAAMLHELGHAMGLRQNSDVVGDIMAEPRFKVRNQSSQVVKSLLRTIATKGLEAALNSQGINFKSGERTFQASNTPQAVQVIDQISQRDLNTLHKIYFPDTAAAQAP
jgi:predicted Zn-dependent protease